MDLKTIQAAAEPALVRTHDFLQQEPWIRFVLEPLNYHRGTLYHSLRVALLSMMTAEACGENVELAGICGLVHDCGKAGIPLAILRKQHDEMTEYDRTVLRGHVRGSIDMLKSVWRHGALPEDESFYWHDVLSGVGGHHEYKRHQPYPRDRRRVEAADPDRRASSDDRIAQIVSAADIFDSLANKRAYKPSFGAEEVRQAMMEEYAGEQRYAMQVMRWM